MRGRLRRGVVALLVGAVIGAGGGRVGEAHSRRIDGSRPSGLARQLALPGGTTTSVRSALPDEPVIADVGDEVIPPPPADFDAPPPPPAAPPPQLAQPASVRDGSGIWAVMIGINDYPGTRADLRSAVADADTMNTALADLDVPVAHRLVVRDTQATANTIVRATNWLVDKAGPDSTAVFFFAGHVRKLSADREAMVGADGGLVTDQELAALLTGLRASNLWVVMASCYGGGFNEVLGPGRILTGAADANHLAYENTKLGHSYLVEYLVQQALIDGKAKPTVQDAFAYAYQAIARDYPDRVPVQIDDAGQVVALGDRTTPPPAPPSSPPPTPPSPTTTTPPSDPPSKCGNVLGLFCKR